MKKFLINKMALLVLFVSAVAGLNAQTTSTYNGSTGTIAAFGLSEFTVDVTASGVVGQTASIDELDINLNHTWMGDIDVSIVSPSGTELALWSSICGSADNATAIFVDGGAPVACSGGTPAINGTFAPSGGSFANAFAGEEMNGTWTLKVDDGVGGDGGQMNAWTMTVTEIPTNCTIECPADMVVSNDPGVCGANVTVPAPVVDSCDPVLASTDITTGNQPLTWTVNNTLRNTDVNLPGAVTSLGDVELDIKYNGDFGFFTERFQLRGPDNVILFFVDGPSPDCADGNLFHTVPQATWNNWVATYGSDLNFRLNFDVDVNNICPNHFLNITASVPTGSFAYLNDYNNTDDASDYYPVGTYDVTFNTSAASCTFSITVNDDEAPTFTSCPSDILVNLNPGECNELINFTVEATDNCPPSDQSIAINNQAISQAINCNNWGAGITNLNFHYSTFTYPGGSIDNFDGMFIGVGQDPGGFELNVKVYELTGAFPAGTLTEIASGSVASTPGGANYFLDVDFDTPVQVATGTSLVVEVETPQNNSGAFGLGYAPNNSPCWLQSAPCGATTPTLTTALGLATGLAYGINTSNPPVAIVRLDNVAYNSGDEWPIGSYDISFQGTDAVGNSSTCDFNITVNEFANPTSIMSCNDNVQVSLPADGVAVVGADMILEGGPYGCYDDYVVSIDGGGNVVDCSNVGETLQVLVQDDNSPNMCWGQITVEDKIDPIIECSDFTVDCNYDISQLQEGTVLTKNASQNSGAQASYDNSSIDIDFEINGGPSAIVNVVTTDINISHTWVSDLNISITSPSGTTATVFSGQCGTGDDVDAFFADANANNLACNGTPVISGDIKPQSPFAAFVGEPASGTWTMTVADNFAGDPTNINNINLTVNYSATYAGPVVTEACDYNVTFEEISSTDDCSGDVGAIARTYIVEDASGNTASCVQTITIARPSMSDLALPSSYDDQDLASLDCSGDSWDANGDGYPNVEETGVPTLNGEPFFNGGPCGFTASYEDLLIDLECESAFKVRRKWVIIDWCTNEEVEFNQHIKVLDTNGPSIECPADMVIGITSGNPFNPDHQICTGNLVVPAVAVSADDCSGLGEAETQLWTADGTTLLAVINTNGGLFTDVEINAQFIVRHVVFDNCGNSTSCDYFISTEDQVAPTAICIEETTTSLNSQGVSVVPAVEFDNGSYDNCADITILVARSQNANFPITALNFYDAAEFDCSDVDGTHMITMLVLDFDPELFYQTDSDGNQYLAGFYLNTPNFEYAWNACMVEINVEDKLNPFMNCPANQSISCDVYYADYAADLAANIYDGLETFGTAVYGDNCSNDEPVYTVGGNVDQCGVGSITRQWSLTDGAGNGPANCTQTISVFHVSDWNIQFSNLDQVEADGCDEDVLPEEVFPTITNDECEMIATSYTDTQFDVVGSDACYKIFREWTVINWCAYDGEANDEINVTNTGVTNVTGEGYVTYTQIFKVTDNTAPEVTAEPYSVSEDADACHTDISVADVNATLSVNDDCTDQESMVYNYGGLAAYQVGGTFVNVPVGEYTVTLTAIDNCGNVGTGVTTVTVTPKAPTAYCTDELIIDIMPDGNGGGMISVTAEDFNFASFDNCTSADELSFSFSADINDVTRTFTCDGGVGNQFLEMWVHDADGQTDLCNVTLTVEDNMNVCNDDPQPVTLAGVINTENADAVAEVEVEVNGGLFATSTDTDGMFTFNLAQGGDYTVAPSYDANIENGVTTFDIVKITQHILGIQTLNSAYKVIAADANNSASVTTLDIVAIRKVILQIDESFPNNTSWRFVDAAYTFADAMNPWGFAEVVNFNNLDTDALSTDFVAVKIGDVTGDAQTSFGSADDRTMNGAFGINTKEVAMTAGNTYEVTFTADAAVEGFQFTMNFDADKVAFAGLTEGVATEQNFGFAKLNEGAITASWNAEAAYDFAGTEVFTVSFTALADANLSDVVSINSRFTAAEAYAAGELQDVALTFSGSAANNYALYQNTPNPFKGETVIAFELAQAGEAVVTIMDVNGKVVRTINGDFAKGFNNVTVKDINTTGVLYYTLESGDFTATKKMIIIE